MVVARGPLVPRGPGAPGERRARMGSTPTLGARLTVTLPRRPPAVQGGPELPGVRGYQRMELGPAANDRRGRVCRPGHRRRRVRGDGDGDLAQRPSHSTRRGVARRPAVADLVVERGQSAHHGLVEGLTERHGDGLVELPEQVAIAVEGDVDRRVPHGGLDRLGVSARAMASATLVAEVVKPAGHAGDSLCSGEVVRQEARRRQRVPGTVREDPLGRRAGPEILHVASRCEPLAISLRGVVRAKSGFWRLLAVTARSSCRWRSDSSSPHTESQTGAKVRARRASSSSFGIELERRLPWFSVDQWLSSGYGGWRLAEPQIPNEAINEAPCAGAAARLAPWDLLEWALRHGATCEDP